MDKSNVFVSSDFHMDAGDVVHIRLCDEIGTLVTIALVGGALVDRISPGIPVAEDATSVLETSFAANWGFVENATGYYLEVASDVGFTSFVSGYDFIDVGNVDTYPVTGLIGDITYYYRVYAYNATGYSDVSNIITQKTTAAPVIADLLDKDGNIYHTVTIGTQEWIIENLKTTTYADDTPIPNITDDGDWAADTGGAYCWYDNLDPFDPSPSDPSPDLSMLDYGALYNWYAINYGGGSNEWYLGSKDDVNKMRVNLYLGIDENSVVYTPVGGLSSGWYWSSSQVYDHDANNVLAWAQQFLDGVQYETVKVYNEGFTRPIRSFTSTTVYALRDTGPAGGWIFNIINLGGGSYTYFEAAPSDIEDLAWSNIFYTEVVGTDTAIGTGQANTNLIINQSGHIASAAKVCDDYMNGSTTGALVYFERDGVEETGWRVPSDADFDILVAYLGGDAVAGGKLKEVGLTHWETPNTGATDEVGFKAIGAGYRSQIGEFFDIKIHSDWFSSSSAKFYTIENFDIDFYSYNSNSNMGFSVRCVRTPLTSLTIDSTIIKIDNNIRTID